MLQSSIGIYIYEKESYWTKYYSIPYYSDLDAIHFKHPSQSQMENKING